MSTLNDALRELEATEANLVKLQRLWEEIKSFIPEGIVFEGDTEGNYDDLCRAFTDVAKGLPSIDGWRIPVCLFELSQIAQMRFDAQEVGEIECHLSTEESIYEQEKHLREYRYRLDKKRRELIRNQVLETIDKIDVLLRTLSDSYPHTRETVDELIQNQDWETLKSCIAVIDTLLGSIRRPARWSDMQRHLYFGKVCDLSDIRKFDWPSVKSGIVASLYTKSDPIPVSVKDLTELVASKPTGKVVTKLKWDTLSDDDFERLIFSLISESGNYENPEWLTRTKAPDRGRDLSVTRVINDSLCGVVRQRMIIQCKHWQSKSVAIQDISSSKEQMRLWEPPRVDVVVIATSGRFTTDAVDYVEKHNQSDTGLRIEMWPESHLERLLASRPALVAEFRLR